MGQLAVVLSAVGEALCQKQKQQVARIEDDLLQSVDALVTLTQAYHGLVEVVNAVQ